MDLCGANLGKADLRGASFCRVPLCGVDLSGADLRGVYLHGIDLRWANLHGADLREANLREADLRWADLRGTDLRGTDLRGAHFSRISDVISLGRPDGWWAFAYLWQNEIWVNVGCRAKSLIDGRTYWHGKENRREVLIALNYAEVIARSRGWRFKP
jgi:hypothetical protein